MKPRKPKDGQTLACATAELVRGAVAETLKYSTKPADMVADSDWFLELTRQTHKRRFVATGGALKDVLKLEQETDQDMVIGDDISDGEDDGSRLPLAGIRRQENTSDCLSAISLNQILIRVSGFAPDQVVFGCRCVWRYSKNTSCPVHRFPLAFLRVSLRFPLCMHTRIHA